MPAESESTEPEITRHCHHCNEPMEESHEVCGLEVCEDCQGEHYFACDLCDESFPSSDQITATGVRGREIVICQSCYDEDFTHCYNCETIQHLDNCRRVGQRFYCESCFSDDFFTCLSCDNNFQNDDYGENGNCQHCHDEAEEENSVVHDYSSNAPGHKLGLGPHYFGVELEIEVSPSISIDDKAQESLDLLGDFVITKQDGSLCHGFELVTCPASLDEQRKRWQPKT